MGRKKLYTEEEKKEKARLYYHLNKEKMTDYIKKYHKSQKGKESLERARQKERDNLTDNYIRQNLATNLLIQGYSLNRKSVSLEHIETLRQILLTKREFKTCKLIKN